MNVYWNVGFGAVQRFENGILVDWIDFEKCCKMSLLALSEASIPPRTNRLTKFWGYEVWRIEPPLPLLSPLTPGRGQPAQIVPLRSCRKMRKRTQTTWRQRRNVRCPSDDGWMIIHSVDARSSMDRRPFSCRRTNSAPFLRIVSLIFFQIRKQFWGDSVRGEDSDWFLSLRSVRTCEVSIPFEYFVEVLKAELICSVARGLDVVELVSTCLRESQCAESSVMFESQVRKPAHSRLYQRRSLEGNIHLPAFSRYTIFF